MTVENAPTTVSQPSQKGRKYFTLSEANRALAYVSKIVDEVSDCYKHAVDIREQADHECGDATQNQLQDQYEKVMDRLNDLLDELHQVGVELKDFEKGLLDFPAMHQGREIYLCWRSGEPSVGAWHELEAGYAGRQDISLLEDE